VALDNRSLESLEESDLQRLIQNEVPEGRTIEYKGELHLEEPRQRKEFLADVSSFANAGGGHLLIGIKAMNGTPRELTPMSIENIDGEKLRLENLIRDGVEPRISGIGIKAIGPNPPNVVLVIRIPRSWSAPHMVTHGGTSKFYSRNSAGKFPMDTSEIRTAFTASQGLGERIRILHRDRIHLIVNEQTPSPVEDGAKVILHLVPLTVFDPDHQVDLSQVRRLTSQLGPLVGEVTDRRFNFDGFLTARTRDSGASKPSYVQVFRNGMIEVVDGWVLSRGRAIPSTSFEGYLIKGVARYLEVAQQLAVQPPLNMMLSLTNVRGHQMEVDHRRINWEESHAIDRDYLYVPEILVESFDMDPSLLLRPAFDSIWNAAGYPRSMNYDSDGWIPGRQQT